MALKNIGWNDMDWSHLAKAGLESSWRPKHYSVEMPTLEQWFSFQMKRVYI